MLPIRLMGAMAFAAICATNPALASDDLIVMPGPDASSITRSMTVDISDLQLSSADGRSALNHRIDRAARAVCGYNGAYGLRPPKDYVECYDNAKSDALRKAPVQSAAR